MKAALSYILVFLCAVMYMVLFDTTAGGIMVVFLFFTPVISVVLTAVASRKINFTLYSENSEVKKNEPVVLRIKARKNTFIPVPFINFSIETSEHFAPLFYSELKFSMSNEKEKSIEVALSPQICGIGETSLRNIYISDYLGIFRFRVRYTNIAVLNMFIRPDIITMDDNKKLFQNISSMMLDNDDDENEQTAAGSASVPGYEYRDYIPGDSMKRVNWKLSSKRKKLLVRKDESASINIPYIFLDPSQAGNKCSEYDKLVLQEKIIESSLSLLVLCVSLGIQCTYVYYCDGTVHEESVSTEEQIEKISFEVCHSVFSNIASGNMLSQKTAGQKSQSINIIYTLNPSKVLSGPSGNQMKSNGSMSLIVPRRIAESSDCRNCDMWALTDDYSLIKY